MSVRDKIAGFGGAATATAPRPAISSRPNGGYHGSNGFATSNARIGTNVPSSSSNARAFAHDNAASGGGGGGGGDAAAAVRKLRVPDVFKNASKPADIPAAAAAAAAVATAGHHSYSSSSAPAKQWGAPASGASNGAGVSASGGRANGNGSSNGGVGSAAGGAGGGGGASQWKAQSGAYGGLRCVFV